MFARDSGGDSLTSIGGREAWTRAERAAWAWPGQDRSVQHISFAMIWTITVAAVAALVMTDHPWWALWLFFVGCCFLPSREEIRKTV